VFARGLLAEAVRAVSRESVDGSSPEANGCQLAVLQQPDASAVAAGFGALEPGGACYAEWSGWRPLGPRRARAELEKAGFVDVRVYWPTPSLESARAWFETSPAIPGYRQIVTDIIAARYGVGSLRSAVLQLVVGSAFLLGVFPELCAVAHRPAESLNRADGGAADFPVRLVESIAASEGVAADSLVAVMRAGGDHVENKVNWLVFTGKAPELRWVVKVPRNPASAEALRQEWGSLKLLALRDQSDGVVVPQVVAWNELEGFPVLVQTALTGESLCDHARHSEYSDFSAEMSEALSRFSGRPGQDPPDSWWSRLVEPWLARLSSHLEMLGEPDVVPAVRAALSNLGDLPLVFAHGDCTPWNATIEGGQLGLFDWEDGDEHGFPLVDLICLLANTAFVLDGTAGSSAAVGSYQRLLDSSDVRGAAFTRALDAYAARVGVRPEDIGLLRMATWLVHSTQDVENLIAGASDPSPSILKDSACLPLLRAEVGAWEARATGSTSTTPSEL